MKKTYRSILILVTLIALLILYFINANMIVLAILDYSKLFLTKLFPVSFIFFVFSSLLIDYGIIEFMQHYLKINTSSLYVLIISMISGFPSGAKYTKELLEGDYINLEEANTILMYSHFPNPLFILGSVAFVLKDKEICFKLLIAIILSNLIIYFFSKKSNSSIPKSFQGTDSFSKVLGKAINNAFSTLLLIYGTSLFFYLVATIITKYFVFGNYSFVLINGFFDLTKGVFSTTLIQDISLRSFFILFFISFGGLSIHMQVKSILADTSIRYQYFLLGRVIGTVLAFILFLVLLKL